MKHIPASAGPVTPDRELVAAARSGELWASEALVRRYLKMVHGLAYRLLGGQTDVDDVVQETFVQAFRSIGRLRDPDVFGSWLGQITVNVTHKALEKRGRRRAGEPPPGFDPEQLVSSAAPPEVLVELRAVYRILDALPDKLRIALVLRRIEGMELTEIAAAMDSSLASIKRWLVQAEKRLVEAMGAEGGSR